MHSIVGFIETGSAKRAFAQHARTAMLFLVAALIAPSLAGCTPQDRAGTGNASRIAPGDNEPVMLAITGYNYTNRHIASFSVDGSGGGNIFVSTPTSGGGGSVCCALYRPGDFERKIVVRWQSDACYYQTKSTISSEVFDNLHYFYKEREVVVDRTVPAEPEVLEVHFYPDGSIHAVITAGATLPRLKLDNAREDKSDYPRCPNDQKPAK